MLPAKKTIKNAVSNSFIKRRKKAETLKSEIKYDTMRETVRNSV